MVAKHVQVQLSEKVISELRSLEEEEKKQNAFTLAISMSLLALCFSPSCRHSMFALLQILVF